MMGCGTGGKGRRDVALTLKKWKVIVVERKMGCGVRDAGGGGNLTLMRAKQRCGTGDGT